jgi:hypothetical protein
MKRENFGAFLSWLLKQEIFLTGFFLSKFHCITVRRNVLLCTFVRRYHLSGRAHHLHFRVELYIHIILAHISCSVIFSDAF